MHTAVLAVHLGMAILRACEPEPRAASLFLRVGLKKFPPLKKMQVGYFTWFVKNGTANFGRTGPIEGDPKYSGRKKPKWSFPFKFDFFISTNRPRSIYQYSNMDPRLSGQNCPVSNSL